MTAKELFEQVEVTAKSQEFALSEDRRRYVAKATVTVTHESGSTFTTPWTAGIGTLKSEQFKHPKKAVRASVSGLYTVAGLLKEIENNYYKASYDHAQALEKVIDDWAPDKRDVLYALVSDAELYAACPNFGDFSKTLGFDDCGKALETFERCRNAYTWLTLELRVCPDDLGRLREELEEMGA